MKQQKKKKGGKRGRRPGFASPFKGVSAKRERNEQLVKLADSQLYTLESLAYQFQLSRQRASQIYQNMTGKRFEIYRKKRKRIRDELKRLQGEEVIGQCVVCKARIFRKDHRLNRPGQPYYCRGCGEMRGRVVRDYKVTIPCDNCGVPFSPYANRGSRTNLNTGKYGSFHSRACYFEFRRNHPGGKPVVNKPDNSSVI